MICVRRVGFVVGAMLAVRAASALAQVPAGPEFRVNTQTLDVQFESAAAAAPNGDFVVVWTSRVGLPADYDVLGQRYSAAGASLGGEFRVNTYTTFVQRRGRVAIDRNGDFVVTWTDVGRNGTFAQRYAAAGTPRGGEFRIDASTSSVTQRIAMDPAGNFVVAWWGSGPGDPDGVFVRRVSASGTPLGSDTLVNTYTTGPQLIPSVAMSAAGDFVVVWYTAGLDGSDYGVFGQRFDATGARQGTEFRVNAFTTGRQWVPSVSSDPRGNFVVAWMSLDQDGDEHAVVARRFASDGAPLGAEFVVNTFTFGRQGSPTVEVAESGAFVVAWQSAQQDGSGYGAFAQRFGAAGARRGGEFRVNTVTALDQFPSAVAMDAAGNFTVVWESLSQDGSNFGVYAQRYGGLVPTALEVDGPGNRVLEPGETVVVQPTWRNLNGATQTFAGTLTNISGPAGAAHTITDGAASYGSVANGSSSTCTDCYAVSVSNPPARPVQHWDATALETIVPDAHGQQPVWALHVGNSFDDVPRTSGFYRFVETILHRGVTAGCSSTSFCPTAATTRQQMAVFLLIAKQGPGYVPAACGTPVFADVPATSPFCRYVEELARRGITGGCAPGLYCPTAPVPREQMAVLVLRTLDPALSPAACVAGGELFADVPAASGFCRWIEELARRGIVTGCGGGNYCPAASVSREQMSVFLSVTFGLTLYGP